MVSWCFSCFLNWIFHVQDFFTKRHETIYIYVELSFFLKMFRLQDRKNYVLPVVFTTRTFFEFSGCKIVTIKNSLRTTCLAHIPIHGKTKQIVGVHFCVRVGLPRYSWVLVCTVDLLLHHGWLYRGYTGQNKRLCNQLMSIRPCRPFTQVSTLAHMVNLSQENAISWTSSLL